MRVYAPLLGLRVDRAGLISAALAVLCSWRIATGPAVAGEFAVREVNAVAGKSAPLAISIPATWSFEYRLLLFRGLPDGVTLSAGFRFQDAWAVSLNDVDRLALVSDPGFEGRFVMEVALVKGAAASPEKQSVMVQIVRDGAAPSTRNDAATVQAPEQRDRGEKTAPRLAAQEEEALMARANTLLRDGDIAAARLLYEHLAEGGSAQGAIAAAQTFDPAYLRSLPVFGIRPDSDKARQWYRRALELGAQDAAGRLSALDKGP